MLKNLSSKAKVRVNSGIHLVMVVVFAVVTSALIYNVQYTDKHRAHVLQQSEILHRAGLLTVQELAELENFVRMLAINGLVRESLAKDKPLDKAQLRHELTLFGRTIDNLLQLRWLDADGLEQVRVDVEAGRTFSAKSDELQDKSGRYYFIEGMQVAPPNVYLSPIDLNVEHGRVVVPYEPTIRISLRTGDNDGLRRGLLIINYNLGPFLESINRLTRSDVTVEMTNTDGFWFVNPDLDICWGEDLNQPEFNLAQTAPDLWQKLSAVDNFTGESIGDRLVSFQRESISDTGFVVPDRKVNIIVSTPLNVIAALQHEAMIPALFLGIVVLLVGGAFILRDYFSRLSILKLSHKLAADRDSLKVANEQLDRNLHQLSLLQDDLAESKRLSSLGMMVAGVSHEMNTPLGGAMLSVSEIHQQFTNLEQALHRGLTKSALDTFMEKTKAALVLAQLNLNQASTIIKSFKRMTLARVTDEFTETNVAQLVSDLLQGLGPTLKKSHVSVEQSIDENLRIMTQPGILQQVLQNLVLNAVEHGFTPGQSGHIYIRCEVRDEHYALSVVDDGCGIDPSIMDKLFEPFVTSGRHRKHSGLGLHVVHQWVNACLYGKIRVHRLKLGSCFEVVLPKNPLALMEG